MPAPVLLCLAGWLPLLASGENARARTPGQRLLAGNWLKSVPVITGTWSPVGKYACAMTAPVEMFLSAEQNVSVTVLLAPVCMRRVAAKPR